MAPILITPDLQLDVFTFYHNGEIITEEEYYRAIDLEEEKADAKWYNFTSENLEILFP